MTRTSAAFVLSRIHANTTDNLLCDVFCLPTDDDCRRQTHKDATTCVGTTTTSTRTIYTATCSTTVEHGREGKGRAELSWLLHDVLLGTNSSFLFAQRHDLFLRFLRSFVSLFARCFFSPSCQGQIGRRNRNEDSVTVDGPTDEVL